LGAEAARIRENGVLTLRSFVAGKRFSEWQDYDVPLFTVTWKALKLRHGPSAPARKDNGPPVGMTKSHGRICFGTVAEAVKAATSRGTPN
jgi:hypothetical protein